MYVSTFSRVSTGITSSSKQFCWEGVSAVYFHKIFSDGIFYPPDQAAEGPFQLALNTPGGGACSALLGNAPKHLHIYMALFAYHTNALGSGAGSENRSAFLNVISLRISSSPAPFCSPAYIHLNDCWDQQPFRATYALIKFRRYILTTLQHSSVNGNTSPQS